VSFRLGLGFGFGIGNLIGGAVSTGGSSLSRRLCFVWIPVCLLLVCFRIYEFFLDLLTRISSLNIKFTVFVLQLFLYSKNVRVTSRRLETGSTSSGSTLQEEV